MIKPTGNKILVRPDPAPSQVGLIIIPEMARQNPLTGIVIACGAGPFQSPPPVGKRVYLRNEMCGYEVYVEGVRHRLVFDGDVIGEVGS
jgi:co-chaperonin GroES (HSP10)